MTKPTEEQMKKAEEIIDRANLRIFRSYDNAEEWSRNYAEDAAKDLKLLGKVLAQALADQQAKLAPSEGCERCGKMRCSYNLTRGCSKLYPCDIGCHGDCQPNCEKCGRPKCPLFGVCTGGRQNESFDCPEGRYCHGDCQPKNSCEKCGRPKCDCPERSHRVVLDGKTCHGDCQPKVCKRCGGKGYYEEECLPRLSASREAPCKCATHQHDPERLWGAKCTVGDRILHRCSDCQPNCEKCWDKGYSTRLWGLRYTTPDFLFDPPYRIPLTLEVKPCSCGKLSPEELKEIAEKEAAKLGAKPDVLEPPKPSGKEPSIKEIAKWVSETDKAYQAGLRDGQAKLGEAKRVAYMQGYEEGKKDNQGV